MGIPRFAEGGGVQSSSSRGFAWGFGGAPCTGPQTLGMGTFPPFAEAQQMVKQLAARSQALLWGQAWTRPSLWCLISLPCWFVARFIPGPFLMTVSMESQAVPLQRAGTPEHHQVCSSQTKSCFCHPEIYSWSLPTSSLFGHGTSVYERTEQGSPGDKRATEDPR